MKKYSLDEILTRRITSATRIPEEYPLVKIHGSIFCKIGGISVVMGKPKAGKSTIIEIIMTMALAQNPLKNYDSLGLEVKQANTKKVVVIDTEQSKGDVKDAIQRVKQNLGLEQDPEQLIYLYLRQDDIEDRRSIIESILEQIKDIHLLILDGFADFVKDPVSAVAECKSFVADLLSFSDKFNIGIIGAIHQNFDNAKTVGHLGSELEKKANGIIQVEKKNDHHIISTNALRKSANFEPIYFMKDQNGNSYKIDKNDISNATENRNKSIEEYKNLVRMAFRDNEVPIEVLDKKEFKARIQRLQNPKEKAFTEATRKKAERTITAMIDNQMIDTNGSPDRYKILYI